MMRLFSKMKGAQERAPIYLRAIVRLKRKAPETSARELIALEPNRVIFSHGEYFDHDAPQRLRTSLDWLL
jgi:hypothetical protein